MRRRYTSLSALYMGLYLCFTPACTAPLSRRNAHHGFSSHPADTLATLDSTPLLLRDLDSSVKERLVADEDDAQIRALSVKWAGIEDLIAKRLMEMEAKQKQISVSELRAQEIDENVGTPSDAELSGDLSFEKRAKTSSTSGAAEALRAQWREGRLKSLERAYVDKLRENHVVQYHLPTPLLSRRPIETSGPARGPDEADVTLIVFSDFTCPYSVQMRRLLQDLEEAYPDSIRIVHQDFPLGGQNDPSWALARAGVCAQQQGNFWPLYAALFDGHAHNAQVELDRAIAGAKLDPQKLSSCVLRPETTEAVTQSLVFGRKLGVRGTPTLFLNGMRITGVMPRPLMHHLIEQEKATASTRASSRGAP